YLNEAVVEWRRNCSPRYGRSLNIFHEGVTEGQAKRCDVLAFTKDCVATPHPFHEVIDRHNFICCRSINRLLMAVGRDEVRANKLRSVFSVPTILNPGA